MGILGSSAALIVNVLLGLYLLAVLLRFLLQIAGADFYNPVSQAIVRVTDPMVRVFRMVIPGYKGVDFSSIVLALVVEAVAICLLITLDGSSIPSAGFVITWAFIGVLYFVITIYLYAIFASIIMSLVMLFSGSMNPHPILRLVWQLTEPLMAPVRRVIPPVGGLDFSPMVIIIVIYLIQGVLDQTFGISGSIRAVVIGI